MNDYSERVAARPHYATYKNRKKTIRQRFQEGLISLAEKERLYDEARERYFAGEPSEHQARWLERRLETARWLRGNDIPDAQSVRSGNCNEECIGAKYYNCSCDCKGVNHGAANGREPYMINVHGMTLAERIAEDLLDPEALEWRKEWIRGGKK